MTTVRSFLEEVKALEQYGHDCCARIDDKIHECCERIKDAYSNDVVAYQTALSRMEQQEILTTYDVLGNERHKTVCELRKSDFTLYTPEQFVETLYKMLYMTGGTPTNIYVTQKAVRDKLIHLLGGDLKEDDDGVDAGRCDEADSDCPDAPAAGRTGDCGCHLDARVLAPITGELRKFLHDENTNDADDWLSISVMWSSVNCLCDAIDAIHAQLERDYQVACDVNERQDMQYVQLKAERDRLAAALNRDDGKHPAWAPESHYMLLPKDADGVPIHVGDVMEFARFEIEHPVQCEVFGVGQGVFFAWCKESGYTQKDAVAYRHAKSDTWEQIIEDALDGYHDTDFDALVARCKALAGDADE